MSTPEVITVNSEVLEAQVRDLLPSQNGFGSELQASNVIMPIIDLTATAEGSGLSEELQTSLTLDSITSFGVSNAGPVTLINNTGFFRVFGTTTTEAQPSFSQAFFQFTDGTTTKTIFGVQPDAGASSSATTNFDFVVFLAAGQSLTATTNSPGARILGCTRQIATITGQLVNPAGFVAE